MKNEPGYVALSIGLGQVIGWGLLLRTRSLLRRGVTEESAPAQESAPPGELAERGSLLVSAPEQRVRTPSFHRNDPLAWLMRRQRGVLAMIWVATLLSVLWRFGTLGFYLFLGGLAPAWFMVWPAMLAVSAVSGALLAWAASRFFFEARRSGEMEMLLTTPVGAARIVSAHWSYLKRLLRWPLIFILGLSVLQNSFWGWHQAGMVGWWFLVFNAAFTVSYTILGMVGLCWAAMYFGVKCRSQWVAIIFVVVLMNAVPYGISFLGRTAAVFLSGMQNDAITIYLIHSLIPSLLIIGFWLAMIIRFRRKLLAGYLGSLEEESNSWLPKFLRGKTWRQIRHWSSVDTNQNR